jgi:hypothetical protein
MSEKGQGVMRGGNKNIPYYRAETIAKRTAGPAAAFAVAAASLAAVAFAAAT